MTPRETGTRTLESYGRPDHLPLPTRGTVVVGQRDSWWVVVKRGDRFRVNVKTHTEQEEEGINVLESGHPQPSHT